MSNSSPLQRLEKQSHEATEANQPEVPSPAAPDSTRADHRVAPREKPPKPRACRSFTRRKMADAMPAIVDSFLDKARTGSVSHVSFLTKFAGFEQRPMPLTAQKRRGGSLARRLLEEAEAYEARNLPTDVAKS